MLCSNCHNNIPDSLASCPYCGTSTARSSSAFGITPNRTSVDSPATRSTAGRPSTFGALPFSDASAGLCHRCRKPLSTLSGTCPYCEPFYERGVRFDKLKNAAIALAVIAILAILLSALVVKNNQNLKDDNRRLEEQIQQQAQEHEENQFYREHAEIVPDDGSYYYHQYGCSHLNLSRFWIYNTEAVPSRYDPCPYCH